MHLSFFIYKNNWNNFHDFLAWVKWNGADNARGAISTVHTNSNQCYYLCFYKIEFKKYMKATQRNHSLLATQTQYFKGCGILFKTFLGSFSWEHILAELRASLVAQLAKNPPAMQETPVWFLGREDLLEKSQAAHSSILGLPWSLSW